MDKIFNYKAIKLNHGKLLWQEFREFLINNKILLKIEKNKKEDILDEFGLSQ